MIGSRLILYMKKTITSALLVLAVAAVCRVFALSLELPEPSIFFPKGYDTNRADQILSVLRSKPLHYLGGLTSYWPPENSTTLVYGGDRQGLLEMLKRLNQIRGLSVQLTFSSDLSRETGSALQAGSWWVVYSHTMPDTLTVRINLAAQALGGEKFELVWPKADQ